MSELKPCPFCGSIEYQPEVMQERGGTFYVECGWCGAQTTDDSSENEAANYWNTRHETPLQKAYREVAEAAVMLLNEYDRLPKPLGYLDLVDKVHLELLVKNMGGDVTESVAAIRAAMEDDDG
jgi:Lar family restriction alleviation protein